MISKRVILSLSLALIPSLTWAQATTPPPMAAATPPPVEGLPDMLQSYRAIDPDFWQHKIIPAIQDQNWGKILSLGDQQKEGLKKDSLEFAEAQFFQAFALLKLNFSFAATELFSDLIRTKIGSVVAEKALAGLEEIAKGFLVDPDFVYGEILNDVEFGPLPTGLQEFVSYYNGNFNLEHGFDRWGQTELKKINPDGYWGQRLKYLDALKDVQKKNLDSAIDKFKEISTQPSATDSLRNDAQHQYSRLIFEKGDYPEAYKLFKKVKLNDRERGFILLERAWSKYYQKDYSRALGLLTAFEAPMFDSSRTPEAYLLKMIIYKELCHYDAALDVLREFKERYKSSLKRIRKRSELRKDQNLVNMALMDQKFEPWVSYLNTLREEKLRYETLGLSEYDFNSTVSTRYKSKIQETEAKLWRLLENKTRDVASQLLDWQEQMTFLDYLTRIDSLRVVRRGDELVYRSPTIPGLTFDRIYWIFEQEYWVDELEDMKSFIESRCSPDDQIEGEFK